MAANHGLSTEFLPVLSRGKHRSPRKGACFMEYASFLAGERWSDHPACTHPLLAALARAVNDNSTDEARQHLAELIPDVIGLTGDDIRIEVHIALRAATAALPVVAEEQQRVMAVAVLTCERLLADLGGRRDTQVSDHSQDALQSAPLAAAWAHRYTRGIAVPPRVFRRQTAPAIISCAVRGIARACVPEPDRRLRELLLGAMHDTRTFGDAARTAPIQNAPAVVSAEVSAR
jgi:hypothetical protein